MDRIKELKEEKETCQKVEVSEEMAKLAFGKPGVVVSFEKGNEGNGCFFVEFVKKENN